MDQKVCFISCGGISLRYFFVYQDTCKYFGKYLAEQADAFPCYDVSVTPEFMEENRWLVDENEMSQAFLEYQALMIKSGNELLLHGRALFHGVAVLWRGYAWIITAPSGTGKTTQLRHWRDILRKEMKVINGDKPLLECRADGSVWVHSSPWRGKEKFGIPGMSGRLGGIIHLKQGKENRIRKMDLSESVLPLFKEFVSVPEDTQQIICQTRILSQMLDSVPVWELENLGDEASALLTLETVERYLEETSHD